MNAPHVTALLVTPCRVRPARRVGFTLLEITISLFVFGLITLLFGAVFPAASQAGHVSGNYAEAALIGQRKMDQCRQAGYANIYAAGAAGKMIALGIVDKTQPTGYPLVSGATTTYSFTTSDGLADSGAIKGFFPAGTTGLLTLGPVPGGAGWTAPAVGTAVLATMTIHWVSGPQGGGTYTLSTIIRNY